MSERRDYRNFESDTGEERREVERARTGGRIGVTRLKTAACYLHDPYTFQSSGNYPVAVRT